MNLNVLNVSSTLTLHHMLRTIIDIVYMGYYF